MSTTHHSKFDSKAGSYLKGRPGYPDSAIQFLCDRMKLAFEMTVVDVGAGTGLLTRSLQRNFVHVIAVEPNDEMRSYLDATAIAGTAEETRLPNHSVHAIFAAQAFHWFDIEKTRLEFKRILTAPFGVAMLWNDRDTVSKPGLIELEKLMRAHRGNDPLMLGADESALQKFFRTPKLNSAEFENPMDLSKESFRAMVLSRSYAPKPNTPEHASLTRSLDELFDSYSENGQFVIPYRTRVYWGHLE